jgi:dihydrofolate reductase
MDTQAVGTTNKVILYMTMTCDGFFAGPQGELDWMSQTPDPELTEDMVALFQSVDRGFIGYPTASGMIPYWRNVAQNPAASETERAIAEAVNNLHPFLVSRQEEHLPWENAELLVAKSDQDLIDAVQQIKQQPGKNLGVPGGIRTAQTFVRLGLVDEFVFMVHPVAIGQGQRIFLDRVRLELVSTKTYPSGVMRVCYHPSTHR